MWIVPYVVEEGRSYDIVMLCNVPVHAKNSISKKKYIYIYIWQKESGIIRIDIGRLVKRPFHQKRKKVKGLLDLMVVME